MSDRALNAVLVMTLVLVLGLFAWDYHVHWRALTTEQLAQLQKLELDLQRVTPGDLVTLQTPGSYVNERGFIVRVVVPETYIVTRLEPPNGLWLSGPGPLSNQAPGRYMNFGSTGRLHEISDQSISFVRRDDPGWEQQAAWFYLH